MPTYEFRCPDGHVFDKFYRSISAAEAEVPCPTCGAAAARQISGGAGLQFKGSGFYLTDYGKNAHRGGARPASGAASSGDGKSGGEGKPAGESSGASSGEASKPAAKPASSPATGGGASSGGDA